MKNYFFSFLLIFFLVGCDSRPVDRTVGTDVVDIPASLKDEPSEQARISFDVYEFDTGRITQGEVYTFTYPFVNAGEAPLVISSVEAGCGCTVLKNYPKGKIMPGEGGGIVVEFNSDERWGAQTIPINVATNTTPSLTQLLIKTDIVVPDPMKIK